MPDVYDKEQVEIPSADALNHRFGDKFKDTELSDASEKLAENDKHPDLGSTELNELESGSRPQSTSTDDSSSAGSGASGARGLATAKEPVAKFVKSNLESPGGSSTGKKVAAASAAGGVIALIFGVLLLFSFLGQLKYVHFETLMRSATFAQFQRTISKVYGQILFDSAVLTKGSTGSAKLGDRSLVQKLRGVNPEKRLAELGREGSLKFDITGENRWGGLQTTNRFNGLEINGEKYNLNSYAQEAFGKNYNDLGKRERWTVEAKFSDAVRSGLSERLAVENLSYRSSVYNGLRQVAGISMVKWLNKAKEYAGKSPQDASKANIEETIKTVTGEESRVKAGSAAIDDEEVKQYHDEVIEAAANGEPTSSIEPHSKLMDRVKIANEMSDAAFLATVACIVNDINNAFIESGKQTELNALNLGHNTLTGVDQTKVGDTVSEATNAEGKRWNGAEDSVLYKQDSGQEVTDADMAQVAQMPSVLQNPFIKATTQIVDNVLDGLVAGQAAPILSQIPGVSSLIDKEKYYACKVILNEYVQYGTAAVELGIAIGTLGTTKGITKTVIETFKLTFKLAAGFSVAMLLGSWLDNLVKTYAGVDYSGAASGQDNYNQTKMGTEYLAEVGQRQINYGRPVSDAEYTQGQDQAMAEVRMAYNQKPIMERYFAISNPFSLTGTLVANLPTSFTDVSTSFTGFIARTASFLMSPLRLTASMNQVFSSKAHAALPLITGSSVGLQESGWTESELNTISNDPDFGAEELETYMDAHWEELEGKYRKCYDYVLQSQKPPECTSDLLSEPDAVKWRWYNALLQQAGEAGKTLDEFMNAAPATTLTTGSTESVSKFSSTDSMTCPTGTTDVGVANSQYTGDHTDTPGSLRLRLCRLSSIGGNGQDAKGVESSNGAVVNALVADKFQKMGEAYAAEKKGEKLSAGSSFRLGDSAGGGGNGLSAAKPGGSMHQLGVAIDFSGPRTIVETHQTCPGVTDSSPVWVWLHANAAKFGFKQYSAEAWHWDVLAATNRC